MEEKLGILDNKVVVAKVATNQMWDDIAEKIYDGDDSMLGTHHWEGCPLPMIPTVEFMDDGSYLLIVTKEGYEAFKSADSDEVIFAGCNGIKGTYDMKKNAIDEVYVVPEEFILEYGASKEVREEFVRTQREKRWKIEDEEEVEIDDETKKKFLRTLPDEMVPDKSDEALNKIIKNEILYPSNEEEGINVYIRFGESVSIIRTSDQYEFENDYEMKKYSYDGKKQEEISYQDNQYTYESSITRYNEKGETIYTKIFEDSGDGRYYDSLYIATGEDNMHIKHGREYHYKNGKEEEVYYYKSRFTIDGKNVSAVEYIKAHPELEEDIIDQMEDAWNFTNKSEIKELKQELDEIIDYINAKSELTDLVDKDKKLDEKLDKANELLQDYQSLNGQEAPSLDGDENE